MTRAVAGKRSINSVIGTTESDAFKRRRTGEPDGGAGPIVREHFRWADLPQDIFCHLASMLPLPAYLQLRLVSRDFRQRVDGLGPVSTASCAEVNLHNGWTPRIGRSAGWYSTVKLTGQLPEVSPLVVEWIASGKWTVLDLLDCYPSFGTPEAQLALLQQLEQRLPGTRDARGGRRVYLCESTGTYYPNLVSSRGASSMSWRERSDEYATQLVQVLQKLQASGQLRLSRLKLEGFRSWQAALLKIGELEELTLLPGGWFENAKSGDGTEWQVTPSAVALTALTDACGVGILTVELESDEDAEALVVACERKPIEAVDVTFSNLSVSAVEKLFTLPLRKIQLKSEVPATPQAMQALLKGIERSTSLEDVYIPTLRVKRDWDFIQACWLKPKLKKLSSSSFCFEVIPGREGLCCTRVELEPSVASQFLHAVPNGPGSIESLHLIAEDGWTQAKIPVADWSAFSSLKKLEVYASHPIVFPWECLSLPQLSDLGIYCDGQKVDMDSGIVVKPARSQLDYLVFCGEPSGIQGMSALFACCQGLRSVDLYCSFLKEGASAAVHMTMVALELPALMDLFVELQSSALRKRLEEILESNRLGAHLPVIFGLPGQKDEDGDGDGDGDEDGDGDHELDQPEDMELAAALFTSYVATKAMSRQAGLSQGFSLPPSSETEVDQVDRGLPASHDSQ